MKANGIDISYEVQGQGEPLLLVAGLGYGRWFWHRIIPTLAKRFQVIAFDNRGAGGSSKPLGPYSVAMMAQDALLLLERLGYERVTILGHSLGGFIAQEIGVRAPAMVSRLILASTGFGGPLMIPVPVETIHIMTNRQGSARDIVMRGLRVGAAKGFAEREPELVERLIEYRMSDPVPPASYAAQFSAGAGMAFLTPGEVNRRMRALTMPTLVLSGDEDRVVPTGNAHLLHSKISGSKIDFIPGAGHLFPLERPMETAQVVTDFLTMET